MNYDIVSIIVTIGFVIFMIGVFLGLGIFIYYGIKMSKAKLTQAEFIQAKRLVAIAGFITGLGGLLFLVDIDESNILIEWILDLFFLCTCCLVIWPLLLVWNFAWEVKYKNKVERDK